MMPNEHTPRSNTAKDGVQHDPVVASPPLGRHAKASSTQISTVAAYALVTLITGGLPLEANADVSVSTVPMAEPGSSVVSTSAADLMAPPAIAPPETTSAVAFAESQVEPSPQFSSEVAVEQAVSAQDLVPEAGAAPKAIAEISPSSAPTASQAEFSQPTAEVQPTSSTPAAPVPTASATKDQPATAPANAATQPRVTPAFVAPQPNLLAQVTSFNDIQGHWAQGFIEGLAARDIVRGFPDGSFRPDVTMTRAQFAAIVEKAFQPQPVGAAIEFSDVPSTYWAYDVIQDTTRSGFLTGESASLFRPEQGISRNQALVSLVRGLKLTSQTTTSAELDTYFVDVAAIPDASRDELAIATENRLVVNYPNIRQLNASQTATRADVAAFIYQALVQQGSLSALDAGAIANQYIAGPPAQTAQTPPTTPSTPPPAAAPSAETVQDLQNRLQAVQEVDEDEFGRIFEGSPSLSIANPVGFGADNLTGFISATYQERTRFSDVDDGAVALGIGLGDAQRAVGVELSYTIASFGSNRDFGTGGFNLKVHRQFGEDFSAAVGWNGFITIGEEFNEDFEDSLYAVATKIFRTREDLNSPFSRVALTAGVGNGQFRLEEDVFDDEDNINVFGSLAVRVVRPVSAIVEWTGQDLAAGLSIVPFRNQSLVITPALRDIAGAGDGSRFVLGVGYSWKF